MSLKVLLADESPTIKKAFEIALKDYGVKIQSVHQGIDVKELCESFGPHICFLDVLLPKLNGYDASAQLKSDPKFARIPTVIMWSGFMELDEDKFMTAGASGKIEKPFESDELRALVQKLVPSLSSNEISKHIIPDAIPGSDIFGDPAGASQGQAGAPPAIPGSSEPLPESPSLNLDGIDSDVEDFSIENLSEPPATPGALNQSPDGFEGLDDLDDFKIETLDDESFPVDTKSSETHDDIFGDVSSVEGNKSKDDDIFGTLGNEVGGSSATTGDDIFGSGAVPPPPPIEAQGSSDSELEEPNLEPLEPLSNELELAPPVLDDSEMSAPPAPINIRPQEEVIAAAAQNVETTSPGVVVNVSKEADKIDSADAGLFKESDSETNNVPQLSKEELKRLILAQSKDIIESVVWDVVPELARELIQKEITKLMGKTEKENLEGDLR